MKISNSKKQLAKIISENGGWREGASYAAQDKTDMRVDSYIEKPWINKGQTSWNGNYNIAHKFYAKTLLPNWHQTILSRDEYFYLYQEQGLEAALDEPMPEERPTIEQLAADYRNLLDLARRKQQEADCAKADADEALRKLELAGEAIGLIVSPITAKQEPELVITDWRDLRVGDEIEYVDGSLDYMVGVTGVVVDFDEDHPRAQVRMASEFINKHHQAWPSKWRFIRRP